MMMWHMIEAKIVSDNAYDSFDIKATRIYTTIHCKHKWNDMHNWNTYFEWMIYSEVLLGDFCIEIGWGLADGNSTRYIEIRFKHNV